MGFIRNTKGSIISEYFKLLSNVECLGKNNAVNIALYDSYLTLSNFKQKQPLKLYYSQITSVFYGSMITTIGKNTKRAFIISYTTPQGENCFLRFKDTRRFKGEKLSLKLKELCGIQYANC